MSDRVYRRDVDILTDDEVRKDILAHDERTDNARAAALLAIAGLGNGIEVDQVSPPTKPWEQPLAQSKEAIIARDAEKAKRR